MALLPGDDGPYVFESPVPSEGAGRALLDHLAQRFTYRDASSWAERILAGDVSLAGVVERDPSRVLSAGEALACLQRDFVEPDVPTDWKISAQGADWMAVSKPSGMPIHSTPRIYRQTLVWQVRRLWGPEWTPAHRLDRDTSGLVLFSRGKFLPRWLARAFAGRRVAKDYLALVRGSLAEAVTVDGAIGLADDPRIALRRAVREGGQEASTSIHPLGPDAAGRGTWIRACPSQGRTHQIRVHCEAMGHPIVGDLLYDGRGGEGYLLRSAGADPSAWLDPAAARLHLHAWRLCFPDAVDGTVPRELICAPPEDWTVPLP
jgi:23S rRNA pseudouridine1911/1915/1917 synthase